MLRSFFGIWTKMVKENYYFPTFYRGTKMPPRSRQRLEDDFNTNSLERGSRRRLPDLPQGVVHSKSLPRPGKHSKRMEYYREQSDSRSRDRNGEQKRSHSYEDELEVIPDFAISSIHLARNLSYLSIVSGSSKSPATSSRSRLESEAAVLVLRGREDAAGADPGLRRLLDGDQLAPSRRKEEAQQARRRRSLYERAAVTR